MAAVSLAGLWNKVKNDRLLLFLLIALIAVRSIYLWSYPFFIEGDGYTYYQLLQESRANLLHATGYVFLSLPLKVLAAVAGVEPASFLRYTQHGFSIVAIIFLYFALSRIGPRWLSFIICLLLGFDTQLIAAAGTTRPEFFQADLSILLFGCATLAFTTKRPDLKAFYYGATGLLMVAGYITKYNSLPLLIFCLLPMFDQSLGWRSSFRMLGYSCAAGAGLFALFLLGFHYRTTGSFHLNLEHGWIQILKLQDANIPILPENGIATKKYIILAEHLPNLGAGAGPWNNIDEVKPEERAPYRDAWLSLVGSTDNNYVNTAYERLRVSGPAPKSYHEPVVFFPVYYCLGLQEGETLLGEVFFEGVREYPRQYLSNVWNNFLRSADFRSQYLPYLPVPGIYDPTPQFFSVSTAGPLEARVRVFKALDWGLMRPEDLAVQIWHPGASVFAYFTFLKFVPTTLLWSVIAGGFLPSLLACVSRRRLTPANILFVASLLALTGVMAFSAIIFVFRMKELILCQPLIYILISLSLSQWIERVAPNKVQTQSAALS